MSKTYKYWTKEDDALLAELRDDRYSIAQIADHMGRTKSSINNRIFVMNLPVRKPKPLVRRRALDKLMAILTGRK